MAGIKKIKRALISVFSKEGLSSLLEKLSREGVEFLSTGGTAEYIRSHGYSCGLVEDVTGYPSILGGRVKTLHPKIFGGILGRTWLADDVEEMGEYGIEPIDLVVVDLYPFGEWVDKGADEESVIEKIDIGGISLIRAAAKNYRDVVIVASKSDYAVLESMVDAHGTQTSVEERRLLATHAFEVSSRYDTMIHEWFAKAGK